MKEFLQLMAGLLLLVVALSIEDCIGNYSPSERRAGVTEE